MGHLVIVSTYHSDDLEFVVGVQMELAYELSQFDGSWTKQDDFRFDNF